MKITRGLGNGEDRSKIAKNKDYEGRRRTLSPLCHRKIIDRSPVTWVVNHLARPSGDDFIQLGDHFLSFSCAAK